MDKATKIGLKVVIITLFSFLVLISLFLLGLFIFDKVVSYSGDGEYCFNEIKDFGIYYSPEDYNQESVPNKKCACYGKQFYESNFKRGIGGVGYDSEVFCEGSVNGTIYLLLLNKIVSSESYEEGGSRILYENEKNYFWNLTSFQDFCYSLIGQEDNYTSISYSENVSDYCFYQLNRTKEAELKLV